MTTTGYEQSDDDTVVDVSAVHDSTAVANVGSTHAPMTSVPSTETLIATLLMRYACVTVSGLALIGAITSELHLPLPADNTSLCSVVLVSVAALVYLGPVC